MVGLGELERLVSVIVSRGLNDNSQIGGARLETDGPIHFFLPTFCFSTFFLLFRSECHSEPVLYAAPDFRAS